MRVMFWICGTLALLGIIMDRQPSAGMWFLLACAAGAVLCDIAGELRRRV